MLHDDGAVRAAMQGNLQQAFWDMGGTRDGWLKKFAYLRYDRRAHQKEKRKTEAVKTGRRATKQRPQQLHHQQHMMTNEYREQHRDGADRLSQRCETSALPQSSQRTTANRQ
jgi:hypothetical protein